MRGSSEKKREAHSAGGLAGWLLGRLSGRSRPQPSLALLERITLAPKQSLALVEADGRRFLVATSADGAPAFYPLDQSHAVAGSARSFKIKSGCGARVSW